MKAPDVVRIAFNPDRMWMATPCWSKDGTLVPSIARALPFAAPDGSEDTDELLVRVRRCVPEMGRCEYEQEGPRTQERITFVLKGPGRVEVGSRPSRI
jgi:hypothetical protein